MKEVKICPVCKSTYIGPGALSRKDNQTEICPTCGTQEALEAALKAGVIVTKEDYLAVKNKEAEVNHICIFEKRYCEFAEVRGNSFNCTAPSDEEMTCR